MALLGFGLSSCDIRAEYGTPHVSFQLSARVIDEEGNPIQGIRVRTSEGQEFDYNTGYSDYQGIINAEAVIWPGSQYEVTFDDIDGDLNGGEFESRTVETAAHQIDSGEGAWYGGHYVADMGDVVLNRKQDVEPVE